MKFQNNLSGGNTMGYLNDLAQKAHKTARDHGWWEEEKSFGELIALVHSELSEALEDYRKGRLITKTYLLCKSSKTTCDAICSECRQSKPEGIPIELADVLIRIFDMCGKYGIDLDEAV